MSRPPLLPRVDEIRSLPVVMLEVFDGCGCRCRMCDLWRPDRKGGAQEGLDLDLLESWLPGWRALGVGRVGLTGGDPLLHGKVDLILEMLGDAGFRLTLMTAGTGLEHHAEAVARWCDSVVVSLDGVQCLRASQGGSDPVTVGQQVAEQLLGQGAAEIIAAAHG